MKFGLDLAWGLTQLPRVIATSHKTLIQPSAQPMTIGLNVAGSHAPAYDDYLVKLLHEAGVSHVRMAWSPASEAFTERLFQRLRTENFAIMVALLPTPESAGMLAYDEQAQSQWRTFVRDFAQRHGHEVDTLEVGNAPNRPKWSGYTPRSYLAAWKIATEELAHIDVPLAGPNISDFEPIFNSAYLRSMRRIGTSPAIHTDNLFVERAVQPEAYDPSAMGHLLKNLMRFNLAKKIYVLADIASSLGVQQNYCSYTCWTRARLARWTVQPERKVADYLARYLVIASATGRMQRLYWGPLIDSRDGLVDCGSVDYPKVDNVAHYQRVRGSVTDFRPRSAFWAFRFFAGLLQSSECLKVTSSRAGLYCFVFKELDSKHDREHIREHHIFYSLDRGAFDISSAYPAGFAAAEVRNTQGESIDSFNGVVGESPMVITWSGNSDAPRPDEKSLLRIEPLGGQGAIHGLSTSHHPMEINTEDWRGVVAVENHRAATRQLNPEVINSLTPIQTLRDKRNKLWTVRSPSHDSELVVKLNRTTGARRLSYLFGNSKGLRHWNNANEMLRRGVTTPVPIAFFERKTFRGVRENYYVSEFAADAFTARDIFTAIKNGEKEYRNIDIQSWIRVLAEFVGFMHRRKIVHHDLSAGNLLIQIHDGKPVVSVIDIGRASIDSRASRLRDLQRICYKLEWPNRQTFVEHYLTANPRGSARFWRLACHAYDYKLKWKRAIKGSLKRSRK